MSNNNLHETRFHVWWNIVAPNGMLQRQEKIFRTKDEARLFIQKLPHITEHGAGCYKQTDSKQVARDGKVTHTCVKEDLWTMVEMRDL